MSTIDTQAPAAGQPIPTPPDFPIVWDDPRDGQLVWMINDKYGKPIPLLVNAVVSAFLLGSIDAFEQAGVPLGVRITRINTYSYLAITPKAAPPDVVMKGMGMLNRAAPGVFKMMMGKMAGGMSKKVEANFNPILERFESYWLDEILPEVKQHLAYFESSDLRGMSLDQLRAHLAEAFRRIRRMGILHGAIMPALYALDQFEELYCDIFEGASTLDALRLTQGLADKILEGDRALWRLSRTALASPDVHAILSRYAASGVIPALENSAACQPFLTELRAWLAHYGQRLNDAFALDDPSWIEDPTHAIEYLQADLALPESKPEMESGAWVASREKAVAEARARLASYPQPIVARFEMLLKAAQVGTLVLKDHNFWIDQRFFYQIRRLIMEFGGRLAQIGKLEAASDVFCLTPDELQNGHDVPLKELVRERKAEMEHFRHVAPPPKIGTMPAFEMTEGGTLMRVMSKGEMGAPNKRPREANEVKGIAGSAGIVRGTARVIHSLSEAGKLQPGDVLVAKFTLPPWTPLFAIASAVVTDTGGVLSHSAVVAREYQIPAVVGTDYATSTFHDGQLLQVDGNAGTVGVVVEEINVEETTHEPAMVG
jgi:phosphohistidine swiveling domain-containing protein